MTCCDDAPIALFELPDDFPGGYQVQVHRIAEGEIVTRELREAVRIPGAARADEKHAVAGVGNDRSASA